MLEQCGAEGAWLMALTYLWGKNKTFPASMTWTWNGGAVGGAGVWWLHPSSVCFHINHLKSTTRQSPSMYSISPPDGTLVLQNAATSRLFFFFSDALQHWTQQWILFLCYLLFDCDIWAMNSICWGESEVVLKRHFSARLQSCKILNQKHFALKAACIWKDQLPQPCAVCSIRYVVQIQVG